MQNFNWKNTIDSPSLSFFIPLISHSAFEVMKRKDGLTFGIVRNVIASTVIVMRDSSRPHCCI